MARSKGNRDHHKEREHRKEQRRAEKDAAREARRQDAEDFGKGQGRWGKDDKK